MKRLFAAIKIHPSPGYISLFKEISSSLRHERIKWIEPENMHLTLKFFGETDETKIPVIRQAIEAAVSLSKPFTMRIANTGIFGSLYAKNPVTKNLEKIYNDRVYIAIPRLFVESNFTRWFKVNVSAGYHYVGKINGTYTNQALEIIPTFNKSDYNKPEFSISLLVGNFGYRSSVLF